MHRTTAGAASLGILFTLHVRTPLCAHVCTALLGKHSWSKNVTHTHTETYTQTDTHTHTHKCSSTRSTNSRKRRKLGETENKRKPERGAFPSYFSFKLSESQPLFKPPLKILVLWASGPTWKHAPLLSAQIPGVRAGMPAFRKQAPKHTEGSGEALVARRRN